MRARRLRPRLPTLALHRAALALAAALPHRRRGPPAGPLPVRFLLFHAWGMGGTIRTTLTVAGELSQRHDVEVISVVRRRGRSRLAWPPRVRVSVLEDRRRRARRSPFQRGLSRLPSLLVHPRDRVHGTASLWTDLVLLRRLRSLEPCVLVTTRPALNLLAARLAPPGVITVGQEHLHARAHRPALAAAIAREYPRLDALTVLTAADQRDYERLLAGTTTRVVRIPNPVPRLRGGRVDPDAPVVVALGRLTRQKGFDLLIAAFAEVAARHPGWTLRIHGGGREQRRLERLVARHGLQGRVMLPGPTRRPGRALAEGSIFVLSSRFEGFPMVLLEAMGKRLAVASFDCPNGPADAIEDGVSGLLVPAEDTGALAVAIGTLIDDPQRRRSLGQAAARAAGRYAVEAIGARWDALLGELGAGPSR